MLSLLCVTAASAATPLRASSAGAALAGPRTVPWPPLPEALCPHLAFPHPVPLPLPLAFQLLPLPLPLSLHALCLSRCLQGAHYPLDDRERILEEGSGSQQYFVKLVPTEYTPLGGPGTTVHTYQFSVTEHLRRLDPRTATAETVQGIMPGVSINYELSPLRARIVEKRRSFGHFLTRVFAIIGGVFVVMGLVDALLFRVIDDYRKASRRKAGGVFGGGLNVD